MATPGGDDIATITRLLASADFDSAHDDEQQDKIYEAEDMLFDQSVRADLADGLAYGAANACTTDNSYERVLSLLLTALVVEAQCLEGETTETTNRLSEALCHLIVKHGTSSSSDLNLTAKASDFLTSVLSGPDDEAHEEGEEPPAPKHMQASSISESLLSIARAPVKNDNRGLYGPGLVLAHAAHCAAPPPVDEDEGKWNSSKESAADAYRRDLIDLLGRRVFALGGAAAPATVAEVELCHTLIVGVTKEEFDGAILRPLKFKLMAAPEPTMETLAAFISILTDSGNGNYIESHLAGGTNLVTAALRQVKNAKPKPRADGAKVMGEIARASPGKGATMATQKLVEAVGEVGPGPDAGGLYTALMNVAVSLLESDVGQAAGGLANDVAIPCLEKAVQNGEGGDATDALRAWMELGGRDPSSVPAAPVAAAAAAGVTVGAAAAASHQPPESMDRMEQDVLAKNRGRAPGGAPASRPGAQAMGKDEASRLDDRIAAKQRASNAAGASQQSREEAERRRQRENAKAAAAGLAAGAAVGAGVAAANSSDRPPANVNNLEDDILAKNRARGGKSQPANAPGVMSVDALDERINAKTRAEPTQHRNPEDDVLPGAHRGNEEDAANANRKIFVAGAAAAAAPGPILKDEQAKLNEFSPPSETNIDQKTMLTHGVVKDEPLEDAPDGSSHEPSLSAAPPPMGGGGAGHSDRYADEHTLRQNPNDPRSHAVESRGVTNEPDVEYGQMTPGDQGDHGVDRGIVSEPGVEYGNRRPEGEDGGGLAVAVAVSPEEEEAFIPAAIEYDPDSKPPLYKNRRFRLYAVGGVILLVILVIGITVGVTKSVSDDAKAGTGNEVVREVEKTPVPTQQPTSKPTSAREAGLCNELGGCPAPTPVSQPTDTPLEGEAYTKALKWMLEEDPLTRTWLAATSEEKEDMMQVDVRQRLRLVEFYFSTTNEHSNWTRCGDDGDPDYVDCYVPGTSESGDAIMELEYSWLNKQHECDWYGVYCGEDNKTRLLLITDNNLNGTLPVGLHELNEMQFIGLYLNELSGTIPTEYGKMKHLINIELHYNWLQREVPTEIYKAEALQRVNFGANSLTGTISTMIGELPSLKGMFYFDNELAGTFPTEIGKLEYLAFTRNHGNGFTGTIPSEIGRLEKVREFWLYGCRFNGTIPNEIGGMKDLETFRLQEQRLTGPLPDSLYDLAQLRQLYIFTNFLNGTISTEVGRLTNAERLVFRKNEFTGTIPTELAKLAKLEYLWLHYNDFKGPVPDEICNLRNQKLRFLNADCNPANETGPITNECRCCTTCCDNVREVCFKTD